MGTRGQVFIKETGVYLYQHYDSYLLPNIVRDALKKGDRWNDCEYLTRIIFCEMIKEDINGSTGYGIGTAQHGDIEFLIIVDTENQKIQVKSGYSEKMDLLFEGTFNEFIENSKTDW